MTQDFLKPIDLKQIGWGLLEFNFALGAPEPSRDAFRYGMIDPRKVDQIKKRELGESGCHVW